MESEVEKFKEGKKRAKAVAKETYLKLQKSKAFGVPYWIHQLTARQVHDILESSILSDGCRDFGQAWVIDD